MYKWLEDSKADKLTADYCRDKRAKELERNVSSCSYEDGIVMIT